MHLIPPGIRCINAIGPQYHSAVGAPKLIYVETMLNETLKIPAILDNGAAVSLCSLDLVEKLGKLAEVTECRKTEFSIIHG